MSIDPYEISAEIRGRLPRPNRTVAPFRWFGGKGKLATWIVPKLPRGEVYCEPFCGAASVFWHLPAPYPVEVLNDLNGEIVNVFRVLQNPDTFRDLAHRITWTPYARAEFVAALHADDDSPVARAWAFMVKCNSGMSGRAESEGNWGRTFTSNRGMADTASNWRGRMRSLEIWHARLTRVQIDNRDALDVIRYWDSQDTVFYLDPPYVHGTRKSSDDYACEMTDAQHKELVETLLSIKGKAVLSGYANEIYAPL